MTLCFHSLFSIGGKNCKRMIFPGMLATIYLATALFTVDQVLLKCFVTDLVKCINSLIALYIRIQLNACIQPVYMQ